MVSALCKSAVSHREGKDRSIVDAFFPVLPLCSIVMIVVFYCFRTIFSSQGSKNAPLGAGSDPDPAGFQYRCAHWDVSKIEIETFLIIALFRCRLSFAQSEWKTGPRRVERGVGVSDEHSWNFRFNRTNCKRVLICIRIFSFIGIGNFIGKCILTVFCCYSVRINLNA